MNNFKFVEPRVVGLPRTKMDLSHGVKNTFKTGDLFVIDCQEILPGDTIDINLRSVVKSITPAVPVMDNAFLDIYFFWVPHRLSHFPSINATSTNKTWERINGENTSGYWAPNSETTAYTWTPTRCSPNSVLNDLGYPLCTDSNRCVAINPASLNAYLLIYNRFFRDENLISPVPVNGDTSFMTLSNGRLKACKLHDLYTSCLPAPQKGESVSIPLGSLAPLTISDTYKIGDGIVSGTNPVVFGSSELGSGSTFVGQTLVDVNAGGTHKLMGNGQLGTGDITNSKVVDMTNLYADLSEATAASINSLRLAFATQRLLERDSRMGSRYGEQLQAHYNQYISSEFIQDPEYLGGKREPLTIQTVVQNSSTESGGVLGTLGAASSTFFTTDNIVRSFKEAGYLMILGTVRTMNTYSQGVPKFMTKTRRFDHFYPEFSHIGEVAVSKNELFMDNKVISNKVFGYQEAWYEYYNLPSINKGYFNPDSGDTILKAYTYQEQFTSQPVLNSTFIQQGTKNFDQTCAVENSNYHFYADFWIREFATRQMPAHPTPGLIDHY